MDTMSLMLGLLAFAGVMAFFVGVNRALIPDSGEIDRRLARYGARRPGAVEEAAEGARSSAVATAMTGTVSRAIAGRTFAQALQADLARADLKLTPAEFVMIQVMLIIIFVLIGLAIGRTPVAAVLPGLLGFWLPKWWLGRRQGARLKAFNEQIADTITLLSNSLRSGLSLLQAMEMVGREGASPISEEFTRVVREIGLGVSPQDALLHMVRRIRSDDLDLMVTAILVQHEVGGNLAKILDTISGTIRERVKLKGEIRSITSQQRMAGYILAGLPVAIGGFLTLIAPSYIMRLFTPGPWIALPVCAFIGIALGFFIIQQIVNIEV